MMHGQKVIKLLPDLYNVKLVVVYSNVWHLK